MAKKDYYASLGISKKATDKEIKSAYRKLARQHHPDVNQGDKKSEDKFKEVSEAYEVLSDPVKRKAYDRFGDQWQAASHPGGQDGGFTYDYGGGGGQAGNPFGGGGGFGNIGDLLGDFFHQRGGAGVRATAPQNVEQSIDISLEEAYSGITKALMLSTEDTCPDCKGNGMVSNGQPQTCRECSGTGRVKSAGIFGMQSPCPNCMGSGNSNLTTCNRCGGTGTSQTTRRVEVKIPAGVADGQKIRVAGQGVSGSDGRRGDLFLIIRLRPHTIFERKDSDLYVDTPVYYTDAALGGEVEVPTINGRVNMKVLPGTQSGRVYKLSGMGMPKIKGGKGDLFARMKITVPKELSENEKKLLTELAKEKR